MPKLSKTAQARAEKLQVTLLQAQAMFENYLQGCIDQMELKGEWALDTTTWTLTKREVPDGTVD